MSDRQTPVPLPVAERRPQRRKPDSRTARPCSERELQALKVLWSQGRATVREICAAINERGEDLAYTTVLGLLQVMEQKGLVGHTATGRVYTYHPKVNRERTFSQLARGFLDRVFDGALDEYVLYALASKPLSVQELDRLMELIDRAKGQPRRKRKGRLQ